MYKDKYVAAIIVAAGKGTRMGSEIPKQYMNIGGKTILDTTLYKFEKSNEVDEIILIVNKEDIDYVIEKISPNYNKLTIVKQGGSSRTRSVLEGLKALSNNTDIVLIHDGVRPFVSFNLISGVVAGAYGHKACIPVTDVIDTIKEVQEGTVTNTLDRKKLKAVQTPQGFDYELIRDCYIKALTEDEDFTDDASIVEFYGHNVKTVEGLNRNLKITTQLDLKIAEILASVF